MMGEPEEPRKGRLWFEETGGDNELIFQVKGEKSGGRSEGEQKTFRRNKKRPFPLFDTPPPHPQYHRNTPTVGIPTV